MDYVFRNNLSMRKERSRCSDVECFALSKMHILSAKTRTRKDGKIMVIQPLSAVFFAV